MSLLEKVQLERRGMSQSPHVAHAKEWGEPARDVKPVDLEKKWREDLAAAEMPRYGKKNGDYYEGVVNERGLMRPGEKIPVATGDASTAHHRYGPGVIDPARPRTPPFSWGDDSGTVKDQQGASTANDPATWQRNLDEAMSGPRFTKSTGNFHIKNDAQPGSPIRPAEAKPRHISDASPQQPPGRGCAGGTPTGSWAAQRHERVGVHHGPQVAGRGPRQEA
jgi:hypothetical protein